MGFSSVTFLFYFLPLVLLVYYLSLRKMKNLVLLAASLLFYGLTAGHYVFLLVVSALCNYLFGKTMAGKNGKWMLLCSVLFNLGLLLFFHAPGVSFFSFQAIAYQVDVYQGKVKAEGSVISYLLYFIFFAKLTAGPLVRYGEMQEALQGRHETTEQFAEGIKRFVKGLFYKCVLAQTLLNAMQVMTTNSLLSAWFNAAAYFLYVAFDFIAYSDMAVGIGCFFGFSLPENFNYPLLAESVRDFWRRWHMTLMRFFKDYVYIPLGGSQRSAVIVVRNIFVVWLLTGLWHGRQTSYLIWGLYFGFFVVMERFVFGKWLRRHKVTSHFYTLLAVMVGFVFFRANTISDALIQLQAMAGMNVPLFDELSLYYAGSYFPFFVFAFLCSTPLFAKLYQVVVKKWQYAEVVVVVVLFVISLSFLLHSGFTPFVYFRY